MKSGLLEEFGISAAATQIYQILLRKSTAGVAEMAATLGITTDSVCKALQELADFALLRPAVGNPSELRAVSPIVGVNALLAQAEMDIQLRKRRIEDTKLALASILDQQVQRRDVEQVIRYDDPDVVWTRQEELATNARHEILSFNLGGPQAENAEEASVLLNQRAVERNVKLRAIYQHSFRNNPRNLVCLNWLAQLGWELRCTPIVPTRMIIYDAEVALVPIGTADGGCDALELRSLDVVSILHSYFQHVWMTATEFGDRRGGRDDDGLGPMDRQLLRLLAQGKTDEAAGCNMGLSTRTVRRMMARLMSRLDARSRFEAGIKAAERGWL